MEELSNNTIRNWQKSNCKLVSHTYPKVPEIPKRWVAIDQISRSTDIQRSLEIWLKDAQYNTAKSKNIAETKSEISKLPIEVPDKIKRVIPFLHSLSFQVRIYKSCIILATNSRYSKTICVKISSEKEYNNYLDLKSVVMNNKRFMKTITALVKYWSAKKSIDYGQLNTNVLTSFGWHAKCPEDERHDSIDCALSILTKSHIENLLYFLLRAWSNHSTHKIHAPHVKDDLKWFIETYKNGGSKYTKKQQLLSSLVLPTEINSNDISNYYIIVY